MPNSITPQDLVDAIASLGERAVATNLGDFRARKPPHRVKFSWPPHPVSYEFHVPASEWRGHSSFTAYGETFDVKIARTPHGVFGRCEELWHEDRGDDEAEMLRNLRASSEPLFRRQLLINKALERPGRFTGHIPELDAVGLLKLLYCDDRDVSYEAMLQIEAHASTSLFFPALLAVLHDRRHPNRRSAQWCVLDLFEDLPSFAKTAENAQRAVDAIVALIWDAEDDFARAIFKAGVVLGGHIPPQLGAPALLKCLKAPSKIGRRSTIHGLFHVVEWYPEMRAEVVAALNEAAKVDPEPMLSEFATLMARDIQFQNWDHIQEPTFPDEP